MLLIRITIGLMVGLFFCHTATFGQAMDSLPAKQVNFPSKFFKRMQGKTAGLDHQISRQTERYLKRMAGKEAKLQQALSKKDSMAAQKLFAGSQRKYRDLIASLRSPAGTTGSRPLKEYIPGLDSVATAMRFLERSGNKIPGLLPDDKLKAIQDESRQIQQLQGKLQQANEIQQFIKERERLLKDQLGRYDLGKQLTGINKEAYYYQQQLIEYKALLHDPDKLGRKILAKLNDEPAFRNFMQKNSYLSQVFGLPDNYGAAPSLIGLQTKVQVQQLIAQNFNPGVQGAGAADPGGYLQQKVQDAEQQLGQLKDTLRALGHSSGSGDVVVPRFRPNNERGKPWTKRMVYGINLQTQQSSAYFPAMADLALTVGYKINDKAIVGIGGSYRLGLGRGFGHISFSGQGAGIRSYLDIKARGNLWITGGLEYNYLQEINAWRNLVNWDRWQKSALLGLSKKIRLSESKGSAVQLLFDAFYKQHLPPSSPILLRVVYSFN